MFSLRTRVLVLTVRLRWPTCWAACLQARNLLGTEAEKEKPQAKIAATAKEPICLSDVFDKALSK